MKSMTGFGKSEIAANGRKIRVEIKTVNHRYLDANIRMPRFMLFLEDTVRGYIKSRITRGRADVFINYSAESEDAKQVHADMPLIDAYIHTAKEVCNKTGVHDDLSISVIMRMPDAIIYEENPGDEDALKALLLDNLGVALDELIRAREKEGAQLKKDILLRLNILNDTIEKIEKLGDSVV
ncbi:MAG: YicC/YloC family endoribonuclease, partial [Christensenellaceae bacterium]